MFSYADGSCFAGQFQFNERHGFGRMKWNEGEWYVGFWKGSKRHGLGRTPKGSGVWQTGHRVDNPFAEDSDFNALIN